MATWTYGMFVWRELSTSDVTGALRFYGELLGWTSKKIDMPNGAYHLLHAGQKQVGGAMAIEPGAGLPPNWMSYVSVPNVDAALSSAKKLGGEAVWGPVNVDDVGRMATVVDPRGAALSLMRSFKGDPDFAPPRPGEFCWEQLASNDLPTAKRFYAELAEWTAVPFDGEVEVFGIRGFGTQAATLVPARPPLAPGWMTFVAVEDLQAARERVTQLGGKVLSEPIDVKEIGKYLVIEDPQGARLGLFQ